MAHDALVTTDCQYARFIYHDSPHPIRCLSPLPTYSRLYAVFLIFGYTSSAGTPFNPAVVLFSGPTYFGVLAHLWGGAKYLWTFLTKLRPRLFEQSLTLNAIPSVLIRITSDATTTWASPKHTFLMSTTTFVALRNSPMYAYRCELHTKTMIKRV